MHKSWDIVTGLQRWMPGLVTLRNYKSAWFLHDLAAGLVLSAILVPVGMGYAEASGVPAIYGLYATIVPLLAYALFGPSRILVLGPDSTLAAVIAVLILPLAAGSVERAIALAGMLAILSGACSMLIGLGRLGLVADLLSKPIRIGFLNAIALTVLIGQLPKVFGFSVKSDGLLEQTTLLAQGIAAGKTNLVALLIGAASLTLILLLAHWRPRWPGILMAVLLATVASAGFNLAESAHVSVVGSLPQGLPHWQFPLVSWRDVVQLLPGAVIISLLSFADTSVLSRALAQRSVGRGGDGSLPVICRRGGHAPVVSAAQDRICAVTDQLFRGGADRRDRRHCHHPGAGHAVAVVERLAPVFCGAGTG
jgi:MFS superfamily sulfate permease-like transporter